jgi:peptide/nickel transport system substrate-binding protein
MILYRHMIRLMSILRDWASILCVAAALTLASAASAQPMHGIARHGPPALPAGFPHLPYANPAAPRGGRLVVGQLGTFDSMNPYIARGAVPEVSPGSGINSLIVQPLMMRSLNEPFTLYGLVAETIETDQSRSWVEFRLNPKATFADGKPVTAEDIRFTFELLREKGRPAQRNAYRRVKDIIVSDGRTIRFVFQDPDGELPMLLALMPALARHDVDRDAFDQPTFKPPLGSGPYVLADLDPGKSFTLRRNPNFWGKDLPILSGHHNFDEIKIDFYRDSNALLESFKVGLYDVRFEADPGKWETGYDSAALREGRIVRESLRFQAPRGMTGIVFNTRRGPLSDVRVREALTYAFDFEWLNRNLFRNVYQRQTSFFDQSELSSVGRPAGEAERRLLAPFRGQVRPDILEGAWRPPVSDGSGRDRALFQAALGKLKEAGYDLADGRMRKADTGQPLAFEFLTLSREQERIGLSFADALKPLGVTVTVRFVDSSLYWRRLRMFDFDSIIWSYGVSASPGTEQPNRFSSQAAERQGSLNYAGVRSPAVDATLEAMRKAADREEFLAAVRALDRTLLSGFYVLPLYFAPERWMARQSWLKRSSQQPKFEINFESWWRE